MRDRERRRGLLLGFLALVAFAASEVSVARARPVASTGASGGRSIYRLGALTDGSPVRATALGDVAIEGAQASCATCHRRSGYGSTEGGLYAPPVTGPSLFQPRRLDRAERFRRLYQDAQSKRLYSEARDPKMRSAYTAESLASALRAGRDPSGRVLDAVMPRYLLGDKDMADLILYLRGLGARADPGVDQETLHFATIFAPDVDPVGRQSVEAVLDAYVERKNQDTLDLLQRPGSSPLHHDEFRDSYRLWKVHRWNLVGEASTWEEQLAAFYRQQPVFAVLGGLGEGEWDPVHEFCEATELPCLFPNVDLPAQEPGAYSLYFSRGLAGEGSTLAAYLRSEAETRLPGRVLQVYRRTLRGATPARALRRGLEDSYVNVADLALEPDQGDGAALAKLIRKERPTTLILWLGSEDLEALELNGEVFPGVERIVLSYGLLGHLPIFGDSLRERIRMTYPLVLPGEEPPRIYRVRAWLRSRGVPRGKEALQLNTYFALTVAESALHHLVERFSRDYFVESVEHETENALNPGVYPRLSLGPGQRFASKGSYVVRFGAGRAPSIEPIGGWIVPGG